MSYERNSDEATGKEISVYSEKASEVERIVMLPMPDNIQRVETGVIQFGDDWPSVHIRGDNAAFYSRALNTILMHDKADPVALAALGSLWKLLESSKST